MATQANANPVAVIRQNLAQMAPELEAALPKHVTVEKFSRVAMTAIQGNPQLQNSDRRSLFGAIVRLAQDGLLPDGREAAIVLFGNKAQAMPMIAGVLKKIRQSGEVAKVSAQVVYERDHFLVRYGFDEDVEHNPPPLNESRGEPIGAYATAILKDGSRLLEVMSLEEIEKVRAVSRAARNGPWVSWWSEMARKTVMRRLSKRLPMSTDLEDDVFRRDVTMSAVIDGTPVAPELSAVPASRLDMLEHRIEADDSTGEEQADELEAELESEAETEAEHDAFGLVPLNPSDPPAEELSTSGYAESDEAPPEAPQADYIGEATPSGATHGQSWHNPGDGVTKYAHFGPNGAVKWYLKPPKDAPAPAESITPRETVFERLSRENRDEPEAEETEETATDPKAAKLAEIRKGIDAATTQRELFAAEQEWLKHTAAYDRDEADEVEAAIKAKRAAWAGGE